MVGFVFDRNREPGGIGTVWLGLVRSHNALCLAAHHMWCGKWCYTPYTGLNCKCD